MPLTDVQDAAAGPASTAPTIPAVDQLGDLEPRLHDAWHRMHAANLSAHQEGRATAGRPALNPHPPGTDRRYWWNEGRNGRPFAPLTTKNTLAAVASGARWDSTD